MIRATLIFRGARKDVLVNDPPPFTLWIPTMTPDGREDVPLRLQPSPADALVYSEDVPTDGRALFDALRSLRRSRRSSR